VKGSAAHFRSAPKGMIRFGNHACSLQDISFAFNGQNKT